MDQAAEMKIVAIIIEQKNGTYRTIHIGTPCYLEDVDFQEDRLRIHSFFIPYTWFNRVIVCNEDMYQQYSKILKNA